MHAVIGDHAQKAKRDWEVTFLESEVSEGDEETLVGALGGGTGGEKGEEGEEGPPFTEVCEVEEGGNDKGEGEGSGWEMGDSEAEESEVGLDIVGVEGVRESVSPDGESFRRRDGLGLQERKDGGWGCWNGRGEGRCGGSGGCGHAMRGESGWFLWLEDSG